MPTEDRGGLSGPTVLKFLRTTSLVAFKLWAPGIESIPVETLSFSDST
jgi:hypothetical protein